MVPQSHVFLLLIVLVAASYIALYAFNRGLKRSKLSRRARYLILGAALLAILLAILLAELIPELTGWP